MSELKVSSEMSNPEEPSPVIINLDLEIKTQEELIKSIRSHIAKLKDTKKEYIKEIKALKKEFGKKKKSTGNKTNNGFSKKGPISPELAKFMGEAPDFQISRTDVTKFITAYVKEHNLTCEDNGRKFNLSGKSKETKALSSLLGEPRMIDGDDGKSKPEDITWFNLQRYLAPHYIKVDAAKEVVEQAKPVEPPVEAQVVRKKKMTAGARRKVKTSSS